MIDYKTKYKLSKAKPYVKLLKHSFIIEGLHLFRIENIQTSAYINVPSKNHTGNSQNKILATQTA